VPWWRREFSDDPGMLAYLERTLRPGDVVVDVGASIGVVALLAARIGCRVLAIEPERSNYDRLRANVLLNDLQIETLQLAITDHRGMATLYVFPPHRRGHHTLAPSDAAIATQTVECTTIDDILEREGIDHVDLLKIDVEGAEPEALAGAAQSLAGGAIRRIVFEIAREPLLRMGHQIEEVIGPLRAAGYSIRSFEGKEVVGPLESRFANLVALAPDPTQPDTA
jgi:FkbM family methyltransferase